jgi:hypothetical protein
MPIHITCPSCNQTVAAPESMAGKKAVCPNCRAVIAVPEQFVPTAAVAPQPVELPPMMQPTSPVDSRAEEEKAVLRILRLVYIFCRDDWRRLPTCGHLWLVFFLFFLPWVNLSCNSRTLISQTGWQTMHGGTTVDPKFEKLAKNDRPNDNVPRPKLDEPPPWSLLSIIYFVFIFLGGLIGAACIGCVVFRMRMFAVAAHLFSLGLGVAAFLALASEMMIGFPIEKHMKLQIEKSRQEQERRDALLGARPKPNEGLEALFDVEVRYSFWLWLSVVITFVSAPVFLLEFVILIADALRKHMRLQQDSG